MAGRIERKIDDRDDGEIHLQCRRRARLDCKLAA